MGLVEMQAEFLTHVTQLLAKARELGFVVTGGELYRTPEQQKIYVETGRSMTMHSNHLKRLAIDLNFFERNGAGLQLTYDVAKLKPVGDYWESLHAQNRWGGNWQNFKDVPHFERNA